MLLFLILAGCAEATNGPLPRSHGADAGTSLPSGSGVGACSFAVTRNAYDASSWWGTISFENDGPTTSLNWQVSFDVPNGVHCHYAAPGFVYSQIGTTCTYREPGTTLAPGESVTVNYSTDCPDPGAARHVVVSDDSCVARAGGVGSAGGSSNGGSAGTASTGGEASSNAGGSGSGAGGGSGTGAGGSGTAGAGGTGTAGAGGSGTAGAGGATTGSTDPYAQARQDCVDQINQYRASLGLPALTRWTAAEACVDGEAKADSISGTAHSAFGSCGEWAQNECPAWPSVDSTTSQCLAAMWAEGPGSNYEAHGHYINMSNPQYTMVACGFYTADNGSVWAAQDFK